MDLWHTKLREKKFNFILFWAAFVECSAYNNKNICSVAMRKIIAIAIPKSLPTNSRLFINVNLS